MEKLQTKKMLKKNMSLEDVMEFTGLSISQINELVIN